MEEEDSKRIPRKHQFIITDKKIGKGGFGEVFIAIDYFSNKNYAAKEITKNEGIENEILIGTQLSNNNLVKIFEPKIHNNQIFIISEYCNGGDLNNNFYNRIIDEEILQKIIKDILFGLSALHRNKIIHHDLKEANILINFDNDNDLKNKNYLNATYKISDFGLSRYKENDSKEYKAGTDKYLAPEKIELILHKKKTETKKEYFQFLDIWSIGIITYQLFFHNNPFYKKDFNYKNKKELFEHLLKNMENGKYEIDWRNNSVSYELICFLDLCLKKIPNHRKTSEELEYTRFITRNVKKFHKIDENYFNKLPDEYKSNNKIILNIREPNFIQDNINFKP